MKITKVVRRLSTKDTYIVFTNATLKFKSPELINDGRLYIDWANTYADMYDVPTGALFIQTEAQDELDAMKTAIEVMETEDFKAYYKEYRAE